MSFIFSSSTKRENVSLEDQASWLSKIFFLYLNPLFALGTSVTADKQIELVDLGPTSTQDRALVLYTEFMKQWHHERRLKPEQRSLWYVLWRTVGYNKLIYAIGLYLLYSASSFGPVLILSALVNHFQGTSELSTSTLWVLVVLMFVIPMVGSVFAAQSNVELAHCGVQFRNAMVTAIYRKSLRLSPGAKQQSSTGQIVNMFSNDTAQLQRFLFFLNNIIVAVPMIIVCLFLIYLQVGVSTFVGLGLIIITIPLNGVIFGWLGEIRKLKVLVTDKRVKLMNEVLNGIRIIKFYAWELAFSDKIQSIRLEELKLIRKIAYIIAIAFSLVLMAVPTFLPVLTFYAYVRLGNQLDAAKAFTAISLFNLLQFPFVFLPLGLTQYSQSRVSTQRMLEFLELEELEPYVDKTEGEGGVVIEMAGVSMGWMEEPTPTASKTAETVGKTGYSKVDMKAEEGEQEGSARDSAESLQAPKEIEMKPPGSSTATTAIDNNSGNNSTKENKESEQNRSVYTLNDLSFQIKKGELVAVVGTVGSGKSSLLNGLLGEMILRQGSVRVCGSIAYCDQRPWILNDTVQGNVLFGQPYDEERFDAALYAANMEDDVTVLPGGINTQIGERGINLSGGQKARVAFARAIYSNADVYLLDDPLSAVDAHVGQFLFHDGIRSSLNGKTRVLVTHQVHLLPYFDKIIVMENGQIKAFGDYESLQRSGIDLEAYVPAATAAADEESTTEEASRRRSESSTTTNSTIQHQQAVPGAPPSYSPRTTPGGTLLSRKRLGSADSQNSRSSHSNTATAAAAALASAPTAPAVESVALETHAVDVEVSKSPPLSPSGNYQENKDKAAQQAVIRRQDTRATTLNSREERQVGDVTYDIYLYYIKAGGAGIFAMMCCLIVCAQACQILSSFWLSYWGEVSVDREEDGDQLSTSRNIFFLNVFAALSCLNLLFYMARSVALADHRLGASVDLHRGLLKATLFAPISFFDVTPIGRILNRFSSDLLTVDEEISQSVSQGLNSIANVVAAIGAIAGATKGTFLILLLPIALFYHLIMKFFKSTNTAIARIESISRSPIYADFSQALHGMTTIRAYDDAPRFVSGLEKCVDSNSVANVTQQIAAQWLAIRLDMIGALISFFMAVLAASAPGFIPPGFLALGLTYSFQLTTYLKYLVRMLAQLEAQLNSVERVKYYMDNIEQEGALLKGQELPLEKIPAEWPARGVIQATDLQLRYREGPLVLKGLSFDIQGAEKVGVAGRTGSGKSSLMIGLFRIQELAAGCIKIDDIDISQVPLSLLRSKLGIIPQDPVMFSASVRFNLDPFDTHSDAEIWQVLEAISMKEHVLSLPGKLAEEVAEGGDNFSAGQRQLICIARAILRKPKILVLDEATASIDNETDALVQRMVREQFQECTVLTIAHRLNTIIDSDKVMVMDDGKLAEFDSPQRLLAVPDGLFHALWDKHVQSHTQQ